LNRGSALAQAPIIAPLVTMNFLHFAIVLFVVSARADRRRLAGRRAGGCGAASAG
jgi:hypothetical protein